MDLKWGQGHRVLPKVFDAQWIRDGAACLGKGGTSVLLTVVLLGGGYCTWRINKIPPSDWLRKNARSLLLTRKNRAEVFDKNFGCFLEKPEGYLDTSSLAVNEYVVLLKKNIDGDLEAMIISPGFDATSTIEGLSAQKVRDRVFDELFHGDTKTCMLLVPK